MSKISGICEVCTESDSKYRCPECEVCTCSLTCVRQHKTEKNCMGVRNRVKMVEKEDMNNFTLLSDYRFLEEIDHKLEDGLRVPLRKAIVNKEFFSDLPPHLKRLKTEARKRGTILEFMPRHLSKHRENSTRYNYKEQKISWHIQWVFPQAEISFVDKSVAEDKPVVDLLRKYMEPHHRLDTDSDDEDSTDGISEEDSQKLAYYQSASYRRISVLLKAEHCKIDDRFTELCLSRSLKINLANRKIVEYPVLYVVTKDHLDAYLEEKPDEGFDDILQRADSIDRELELSNHQSVTDNNVAKSLKAVPRVRRTKEGLSFFDEFSEDSE